MYTHLPIKSTFFVRHDLQQGPNNISASSWRWRRHPPGLNWQREGKLKFYPLMPIIKNGLLSELSSMNVNSMPSSKKADFFATSGWKTSYMKAGSKECWQKMLIAIKCSFSFLCHKTPKVSDHGKTWTNLPFEWSIGLTNWCVYQWSYDMNIFLCTRNLKLNTYFKELTLVKK